MRILVTGGSGFIGSAVIRTLIANTEHAVVNFDKLTYASTEGSVAEAAQSDRYAFVQGDVCDSDAVVNAMQSHEIEAVMHLAAESHVDRSIEGPGAFMQTNIMGTYTMLEASRACGIERFHHVSTDEVFGSLAMDSPAFTEQTPYDPRSPYSASKAASDHLVRAWGETYDLDVVVTNCSNNYGPFHFPEKLIPLVTLRALAGESLPVYGTGENVRDWLYVDDHARALTKVIESGRAGETYNIGGESERTNLEVVHAICDLVDELAGALDQVPSRRDLITFVADRPGHDLRYAIDQSKIASELSWRPEQTFEQGLRRTVHWYLQNEDWWGPLVEQKATARRGLAQ